MRVICVCMSPALDATVRMSAWPADGSIAKDVDEVENVGGKGINVARWLARRGVDVACGGLLGADNAGPFERELARCGIVDRFLRVPGATRRNEMFVTPGGSFKVNRRAFPQLPKESVRFDLASLGVQAGDVVVLSGSLPACCGTDFYADATRELKARGATVVLDASGEPLMRAVRGEVPPDVVKPNAEECGPLVGFVPRTADEFRRASAELGARVMHPLISDGAGGCWFDGAWTAAPDVEVLDTTAAGDTLLAEWCYRAFVASDFGFTRAGACAPARAAARWAVAAGSAACTMPGGDPPPAELVARLCGRIAAGEA